MVQMERPILMALKSLGTYLQSLLSLLRRMPWDLFFNPKIQTPQILGGV